jgi:hypothetical protein
MIEKNKNKIMVMYVMINAMQATKFHFLWHISKIENKNLQPL